MQHEIYCKLPTDINYEIKVESNNELDNVLQLIKMVLGTKPGEVLANPMFGVDLEKYLFSMNYNTDEIKQMIIYEIESNVIYNRQLIHIDIDVNYGHNADDAYEYALIDIKINEQKCLGIIVNQM